MSERVFFNHTVAAMFLEAFPPASVPGLVAGYRERGLDVERPLLPAYAVPVWRACLELQRRAVFPDDSLEEASRKQGVRYTDAYLERTLLGGALLAMLRVLGPRRAMERMTRNFRSGNNFSEATFTVTGPDTGTLWLNDIFSASPHYIVGMLEQGLHRMGSRLTLTPLKHEGDACTFSARWA